MQVWALSLADRLRFGPMLPLAQRRIVITRSRHQASELAARVEALGGTAILIPTIEVFRRSHMQGWMRPLKE